MTTGEWLAALVALLLGEDREVLWLMLRVSLAVVAAVLLVAGVAAWVQADNPDRDEVSR